MKKAFTLIELLVVIAIVGILSSIVVVYMNGATDAARDSIRKTDISTLRKALLAYNALNSSYPVAACADINSSCTALSNALVPEYLPSLPDDPNSASSYSYTSTNGTDFTVSATLSDATGYSYTASTGFGTTGGGSGSSYVSTCEADMGGGISCTETTVGGDAVYTFTGTGTTTWTPPIGVTSVDYLVVGGGGAGGSAWGAGGGAGGYLTSIGASKISPTSSISLTVGAGGTVGTYRGNSGGNSEISGSGFTIVTAKGGGAGGSASGGLLAGLSGGSGGGSYGDSTAGGVADGTPSSQGNAGGAGVNANPGGGGGSGAVGTMGSSLGSGNGGNGTSNSITGSAITYAGGGSGGTYDKTVGTAGTGGGGVGGRYSPSSACASGTNGLGGGGGGGAWNATLNGCAGGSGIVIIRFTKP